MQDRREFLQTTLAGSLLAFLPLTGVKPGTETRSLIKPPALKPGDTVGLVTPASAPFEGKRTLIAVREKLSNLGFKTKIGKHVLQRHGYLAGTVEERVADLHTMFRDDEVKAIMAIRGGYGCAQLLPYLDYSLIRKHPKILIGYSDITALLIAIYQQSGLVTFHGPVAVSTFTEYTRKYFLDVLGKPQPAGEIEDAPYEDNLQTSNRIWTVKPGRASGKLIGGNLTLLQSTLGTPFEMDTDDAILFLEEVGEEPYDLDRLLTHLKLAGKLDHCRAVFFDKLGSVEPADYKPGFYSSLSVETVIEMTFREFDYPVCVGISIGHVKDKPTLPLGVQASLDADQGTLTLLESAVS